MELYSGEAFIAHARRGATKYDVAVPKRHQSGLQVGEQLEVVLRDPEPRRAASRKIFSPDGIDWAAAAPDLVLPIQEGESLVLHSRYEEPFTLKRLTPYADIMWLLGFYYAEGSKSGRATDWCLAGRNLPSLEEVVKGLGCLGVGKDRLYAEALFGKTQTATEIEAKYRALGLEITAIRKRPGAGYDAGVLHVRRSLNLKRMFDQVYQELEAHGWENLPEQACRDFAFGFLEGDGSVVLYETGMVLSFVGADETQSKLVLGALNKAMGWGREHENVKSLSSGGGDEQRFSIDALQAARLLHMRVFERVSSHERLVFGLKRQTVVFTALWGAFKNRAFSYRDAKQQGITHGGVNAMRLHGYVEGEPDNLRFAKKGRELADLLDQLPLENL